MKRFCALARGFAPKLAGGGNHVVEAGDMFTAADDFTAWWAHELAPGEVTRPRVDHRRSPTFNTGFLLPNEAYPPLTPDELPVRPQSPPAPPPEAAPPEPPVYPTLPGAAASPSAWAQSVATPERIVAAALRVSGTKA